MKRKLVAGVAVVALSFTTGAAGATGATAAADWWNRPKPPRPGT